MSGKSDAFSQKSLPFSNSNDRLWFSLGVAKFCSLGP